MFNKKEIRKTTKFFNIKRRVYELEELICPFNQHQFVEIDYTIEPDFDCEQIDSHCKKNFTVQKM